MWRKYICNVEFKYTVLIKILFTEPLLYLVGITPKNCWNARDYKKELRNTRADICYIYIYRYIYIYIYILSEVWYLRSRSNTLELLLLISPGGLRWRGWKGGVFSVFQWPPPRTPPLAHGGGGCCRGAVRLGLVTCPRFPAADRIGCTPPLMHAVLWLPPRAQISLFLLGRETLLD